MVTAAVRDDEDPRVAEAAQVLVHDGAALRLHPQPPTPARLRWSPTRTAGKGPRDPRRTEPWRPRHRRAGRDRALPAHGMVPAGEGTLPSPTLLTVATRALTPGRSIEARGSPRYRPRGRCWCGRILSTKSGRGSPSRWPARTPTWSSPPLSSGASSSPSPSEPARHIGQLRSHPGRVDQHVQMPAVHCRHRPSPTRGVSPLPSVGLAEGEIT